MLKRHKAFWLGFSAALGGLLAVAVVATASSGPTSASVAKRGSTAVPSKPAAAAMSALRRPATAVDHLPPQASAIAEGLLSGDTGGADLQPGALASTSSRRLLANLGSQHVDLFAIPTSKGQVCTVFSKSYDSAGCFSSFGGSAPISYDIRDVDQINGGLPAIVDGLVPDGVAGVDVRFDGTDHPATVANNAFFYELPTGAWPETLIVHYTTGQSTAVAVAPVPKPHQ